MPVKMSHRQALGTVFSVTVLPMKSTDPKAENEDLHIMVKVSGRGCGYLRGTFYMRYFTPPSGSNFTGRRFYQIHGARNSKAFDKALKAGTRYMDPYDPQGAFWEACAYRAARVFQASRRPSLAQHRKNAPQAKPRRRVRNKH